jgi:hypothetical protein
MGAGASKYRWLVPWVLAAALLLAGCKKATWLQGQWLRITRDGKPAECHQFQTDGVLTVYVGSACEGKSDPLLSGKYQVKDETRLAVKRGNEDVAQLVLVSRRGEGHFVATGTLAGGFYRVDKKGTAALVARLEKQGAIRVRALPARRGCHWLGLSLDQIKALPTEPRPRVIRQRDVGLEFHVNRATRDPNVEKVVYALNQDVIEWMALHLTPAAFRAQAPDQELEQMLGKPVHRGYSGTGERAQVVGMWRAYCANLRGAYNKDVDLTLFSSVSQRQGVLYLSENYVSSVWENLRAETRATAPASGPPAAAPETPADAPEPAKAAAPGAEPKGAAPASAGGEDDDDEI